MKRRLATLGCAPLLFAVSATAQPVPGADMLRRASEAMSSIPFGRISDAAVRRLRIEGNTPCHSWTDCSYFGDGPVAHSIDSGRVVVKWLTVKGDGAIGTFGIGTARRRADVMARIEARLPGVKFNCFAFDKAGPTDCSTMLGAGSMQVNFDKDDRLTHIRLDDWSTK